MAAAESQQCKLGPITGYTDYSIEEHQAFHILTDKVRDVYIRHGFAAFYPRPVERIQNLLLKGGIGKQIYSLGLRDGSEKELALPFDRTVSLALFVAENYQRIAFPFKRFDISYSFRGEHAQAGRFRGFFQADIDIVSPDLKIEAEVECISTIYDTLTQLNIGDFCINVNNINLAKTILSFYKVPDEQIPDALRIIDKMDKVEAREIVAELQKLLSDLPPKEIEQLVQFFSYNGSLGGFQDILPEDLKLKCRSAFEPLQDLMRLLRASGVNMERVGFSPKMVRGLDYYTGIVFETFLKGRERFGSIASGGRYDNLVDSFSGHKSPCKGFGGSIGLTRLFDICLREGMVQTERQSLAQVLIAIRAEEFSETAQHLGRMLRENGINTDLFIGEKKMRKQLEYADRKKIPFSIMIMAPDAIVVKNMQIKEHDQGTEYKTLEEAVAEIIRLLHT